MLVDLEWSKINNEKVFQRLSNHLFAFECLYSGFVPSSPYIGKDGGWDGRWKGEYEGQKGLFSIQAKWTTKSFDDAASHLKDELPGEIKNAEQQKVDHLIITTNAELRVDHIVALEKLKRRKLKTLQIWHREKLDLKLKGHPFLCYYYFGNAQFPSFVPASIYFPAYEAALLEGNLVGRDKELEEIAKEVLLKQGTITVVHAPGGHGKSHFLQGCAGRLENYRNGQVLFVRPFLRNLQDAVQDELVAGRDYILCLDDADRFLEEVPKLISLTRANPNVRVVLACRTAGLRLVKDAMQNYRTRQTIVKELRSLGEADLKQILFAAAGRSVDKAEQIIAALDGVPFLIVQYGKRIGKSITDEEISKIYDLLGTSVADDAARVLNQILAKADQEDLLLHLAAIVPFRENDQVVTKLAEVLERPTRIVNLSLERLLEGKVLRRIGNNVRFYPDMSGDIYLSSRLAGDPNKSERLFDTWFIDASSQIVSNLAGAASFEKTDAIKRMLSRTIRRWIDASTNESSWRRVEKLKYLQQIAHLAPIESLDLIHAYLPAAPLAKDTHDHPNLDDFGPVVLILSSYAPLKILQLIKKIEELGLQGRFDTYKSAQLARFLVSPIHQTIATIQIVANELLAWVSNQNVSVTEAYMAAEATKEILAGAHEHSESFRDTMTFGERVVKNLPGVYGLRDTALAVVKVLLNNKKYCDFGVDIADDIGSTRMHRIHEAEIPLADRIASDRRTVLSELEALNLDALNPVTVSKIEDLLLKWWLMNKRGTQEATKILTKIKRTAQYRFIKRYISPDYVVDDFERLLQEAPAQDRWNWWWDTYGKQMSEPDADKMEALAKELAREHQTPEEIRAFLIEVDRSISPLSPWANPPILKFWVDENPEPFLVLTGPDHWNSIPQRFQGHISTAIVQYNQDYVQRKCREIVGTLPDISGSELHDFMNLVTLNRIPFASLKETFFEIAKRGSNLNRGYFVYLLYFYFKDTNDGDSYLELINAVTHDDLSNVFCNHLAFSLHTLKTDFKITKPQLFDSLRSTVRPLIHTLKKLDYHALEVVEFVCGNNIDEYIDLIDRRISAARLDSSIDVIPLDGLPSVKRAISSQQSFNKFVDRILLWQGEKSLSSFDVGYLVESIADTKNGSGVRMLETWTRGKLSDQREASFREATSLMNVLEFDSVGEECWLLALETGSRLHLFDIAKKAFTSFLFSGAIESRVGEVPEIYTKKHDMCRRLMDKASAGEVKSYLKTCLESIERDINDHLKEDEEFLNPK